MAQINRRPDDSEIMYYNDPEVPFYVSETLLSHFPNREMLCHWHDDVEFIHVMEGKMVYHVNGDEILLAAGQAILVNSRQLHHSHADGDSDCRYTCVVFRPEVLSNNISLRSHYIDPVVNAHIPYILMTEDDPICVTLDCAARLHREKEPAFELRVLSQLNQMWALLYAGMQKRHAAGTPGQADPDVAVQKQMVDYIYHNYPRRLTLGEVAQAGGVCKSKCCQIFKKYLRKTPGEFLMAYRLEAAAHMLRSTSQSVTEIAYACGFNSPSYFSEAFRREHNCTPRYFRQRAVASARGRTSGRAAEGIPE